MFFGSAKTETVRMSVARISPLRSMMSGRIWVARDLREKLSSKKGFVWVKREITPRQQVEVHRLGIPGVAVRVDTLVVRQEADARDAEAMHLDLLARGDLALGLGLRRAEEHLRQGRGGRAAHRRPAGDQRPRPARGCGRPQCRSGRHACGPAGSRRPGCRGDAPRPAGRQGLRDLTSLGFVEKSADMAPVQLSIDLRAQHAVRDWAAAVPFG
jgi:hypothetical protein